MHNHKDLIGNIFITDAFERVSNYKYGKIFLAQDKVQQKVTHQVIKDQDIMGLINSDVALFSFDGVELDSGTVVEFMIAKMLDIPSVIYRTDFRGGSGEEAIDQFEYKWNLMVSFYPRTKVIQMNGMVVYQEVMVANPNASVEELSRLYAERIATELFQNMEEVMKTKPLISAEEKPWHIANAKKMLGVVYE